MSGLPVSLELLVKDKFSRSRKRVQVVDPDDALQALDREIVQLRAELEQRLIARAMLAAKLLGET